MTFHMGSKGGTGILEWSIRWVHGKAFTIVTAVSEQIDV